MSDPIEDLENFNEGMDVNPLPASEVRRRGTRLRRRNHALATLGGIAAVAIIAVPLALSANGSGRSAPDPGPATSTPSTETSVGAEWLQRIPDGFPLTEGFPATNGSDGSPVAVQNPTDVDVFPPCLGYGDQRSTPALTVDKASVQYDGESEDTRQAVLAVYQDQEAATAALQQIEDDIAGCPTQTRQGTTYLFDALPSDLGEQSFTWTYRLRQGGELSSELSVVQNVRVGNAIYALSYYGAGGANQQVIDFTRQLMAENSATVVSDLCVFAAEPCDLSIGSGSAGPGGNEASGGSGTSDGSGSGDGAATAIPADFPILDGYPDDSSSEGGHYGIQGPSRDVDPLDFKGCGARAADPNVVEQLNGGWTNPEDIRHRQLTTFATTAEAQGWVDQLLQVYRDCPTEDGTDGYTTLRTVLDGDQGDQSASAVTRFEFDGSMAPGLDIVTVVRTGRAVLVSTTYNEGSATTQQELADAAASDADAVSVLVDAMCPWTEQGC